MTRGVLLRGSGFAVGVALAGVGVWLIVTGTTQKGVELGALAGFWGLAIGALAMPASRRMMQARDDSAPGEAALGTEVELRSARTELARAEEAAARRAHELRLEHMLRSEIQTSVSREVDELRSEIAALRSELLEKVGGQLRLERTETTRVIGSNFEALQHEMRQLKYATQEGDFGAGLGAARLQETGPVRKIVEPARIRPVSRQTAEVEADVQPARQPTTQPERGAAGPQPTLASAASSRATGPIRLGTVQPIDESEAPGEPAPTPPAAPTPAPPAAPAQPSSAPAPPPRPSAPAPATPPAGSRPTADLVDDFAGLPRIRPFTEFELDPIEDEAAYTGRRRRSDEDEARAGRHTRPAEPPARRHSRAPKGNEDLLARLLAGDS
jgi:hypothetical protein